MSTPFVSRGVIRETELAQIYLSFKMQNMGTNSEKRKPISKNANDNLPARETKFQDECVIFFKMLLQLKNRIRESRVRSDFIFKKLKTSIQ